MNRIVLVLALSLVAPLPAAAVEESDGAALYVACAVCHQPDGAGIEGSFPPLRGRLAAVASTPAGRGYLVLVLAKGLFGSIEVAGVPYYGAMPAQGLSDAQIAAVLNYVVGDLNADTLADDWTPFESHEVARIRARNETLRSNETRGLRDALAWEAP